MCAHRISHPDQRQLSIQLFIQVSGVFAEADCQEPRHRMEYDMAQRAHQVQRACFEGVSLRHSIFILGIQHEPAAEHGIREPKHVGSSHPSKTIPNDCLFRPIVQEDRKRKLAFDDIYGESSNFASK